MWNWGIYSKDTKPGEKNCDVLQYPVVILGQPERQKDFN